MSYEKTVWSAGDVITSEKLNHLEGGVEAAANKPVFAPEIVTSEGDVSITYNGNQIGVLIDSGTLTLKTKDTICEDDIEVEYTKPSGGSDFPTFNIDTSGTTVQLGENDFAFFTTLTKRQDISGDKWIANVNPITATHYVPSYNPRGNEYTIAGKLISDMDKYNVTINGIPVSYGDGAYSFYNYAIGYNTNVSIVISDK